MHETGAAYGLWGLVLINSLFRGCRPAVKHKHSDMNLTFLVTAGTLADSRFLLEHDAFTDHRDPLPLIAQPIESI